MARAAFDFNYKYTINHIEKKARTYMRRPDVIALAGVFVREAKAEIDVPYPFDEVWSRRAVRLPEVLSV